MAISKTQRQHQISELIAAGSVASQADLVARLADVGIVATQATVSRDLHDMGAIKVKAAHGQSVYAVPESPIGGPGARGEEHLRRILADWVVDLAESGNLVVLRTPPGSAHVVGSALDRSPVAGVIGTVAGDDTVLVITAQSNDGAQVASSLRELSGLDIVAQPS